MLPSRNGDVWKFDTMKTIIREITGLSLGTQVADGEDETGGTSGVII